MLRERYVQFLGDGYVEQKAAYHFECLRSKLIIRPRTGGKTKQPARRGGRL